MSNATTRTALRKAAEVNEAREMGIIHNWEWKDQIAEIAEYADMSFNELLSELAC